MTNFLPSSSISYDIGVSCKKGYLVHNHLLEWQQNVVLETPTKWLMRFVGKECNLKTQLAHSYNKTYLHGEY